MKRGKHELRKEMPLLYGDKLNFAASEAYKLLRTNLLFALPYKDKCRVVGVTSSRGGEGKSTTSVNLAYSLAEAGHDTLLLEADLRLPTIAKRLGLRSTRGLSNILAVQADLGSGPVIQESGIHEKLRVLSSGGIPPNPSELLGSEHMRELLNARGEMCAFISVDLPPVNAVSDALAVSRWTDGLLMVVRQNYVTMREVDDAMRQLSFAGVKVLGFVMTDSDMLTKGKKKYHKKDSYGYGYGCRYRPQGPGPTQRADD